MMNSIKRVNFKLNKIFLLVFLFLINLIAVSASDVNLKNENDSDSKPEKHELVITINKLKSENAPVILTLYNPENKFLSETDVVKIFKFYPKGKKITAKISDLSYGEYAIATYQDLNSDNECNRSFIGIPKEPYGFSKNFRPTIRAPRFNECKFSYSPNVHKITINMIN